VPFRRCVVIADDLVSSRGIFLVSLAFIVPWLLNTYPPFDFRDAGRNYGAFQYRPTDV
jgi:hypothetical protein